MATINNSKAKLEAKVKTMPNSENIEKSLLSVIMRDPEVAADIFAKVNDSDFYVPRHQELYRNLVARYKDGKPFDPVGVISGMTEESLSKCGGELYIFDVAGFEYSSATFEDDIVVLKDLANARKLLKITDIVQSRVYNNEKADDIIAYTQDELFNLKAANEVRELKLVRDASPDVMNNIYEAYNHQLQRRYIPTGFSVLDNYINGGFYPSQMLVLAARPGKGKTAFAMNIVQNIAREDPDRVIAVFSLEMAREELIMRMYSNETKVDNKLIKNAERLNDAQIGQIQAAQKKLDKANIYIDDSSKITMNEISLKVRRLKSKTNRIDLVVIDHMQLITDSANRQRSRYEQMTDISRSVKVLAKDLQIPVLVLSQMSRNYEQQDNNDSSFPQKKEKEKRLPRMSDLRESGAIEQDADLIMFITEADNVKHPEGVEPIGVFIAKNRSGENEKTCYYEWNKGAMLFKENPNPDFIDKPQEEKKEDDNKKTEQPAQAQSNEFVEDPQGEPVDPGENNNDIEFNQNYMEILANEANVKNEDM